MVVNSTARQSEYEISMSAESSSNTKCEFDVAQLRDLLSGSGKSWRNTCKKALNNQLSIVPAVTCDTETSVWKTQFLKFQLKFANKVEIHVDDKLIFSVRDAS